MSSILIIAGNHGRKCYLKEKEVEMQKIGLDQMEDPPINAIAKAVGEVIEESNKRILKGGNKL